MDLVHLELTEANAFVRLHHRHHKPVQGHRFSLGCVVESALVGVAVVGRPVGGQDQDRTLEVTRLCTDGTANACSFLYGASAKAGRALGFERIQTFILEDELGSSLKASGWEYERLSHPSGWHHDCERGAREVPTHLSGRKQLWFKILQGPVDYKRIEQAQPDLLTMEF